MVSLCIPLSGFWLSASSVQKYIFPYNFFFYSRFFLVCHVWKHLFSFLVHVKLFKFILPCLFHICVQLFFLNKSGLYKPFWILGSFLFTLKMHLHLKWHCVWFELDSCSVIKHIYVKYKYLRKRTRETLGMCQWLFSWLCVEGKRWCTRLAKGSTCPQTVTCADRHQRSAA